MSFHKVLRQQVGGGGGKSSSGSRGTPFARASQLRSKIGKRLARDQKLTPKRGAELNRTKKRLEQRLIDTFHENLAGKK